MVARDRFMSRRPSPGTPTPTKTPAPGGRPSMGTPTPTPRPTPDTRPSIEPPPRDPSQPFNINLDEFLQNPGAIEEQTKEREEFMRGGSPQGALGGEPIDVASAKMGSTPDDEDTILQMMQEYGPMMDDTMPPGEAAPSARMKLQQKMQPTPEPTPTPNIRPKWNQLGTPTPAPAKPTYDEELVQELLGKRRG